ncbi:MAG: hypothetical protein AB1420_07645, partial [Bacillota bacterium]
MQKHSFPHINIYEETNKSNTKTEQKNKNQEYLYLLRDLQQSRAVELKIGNEHYLCRTELAGQN